MRQNTNTENEKLLEKGRKSRKKIQNVIKFITSILPKLKAQYICSVSDRIVPEHLSRVV